MKLARPLALSWLALFLLQAASGAALLSDLPTPEGSIAWLLGANLLTAGMMLALARFLSPGIGRAATLFVVWGGIQANNLAEAFFFDLDIGQGALARMLLQQLLVAAGLAVTIDRLAGPGRSGTAGAWPASRSAFAWTRRVLGCDVAYIVAYFVAGMLVYPFVQAFYETRTLPGPGQILAVQVFRGLVLTGLVALLLRRLAGERARVAVFAGLTLSILGGVAPLLPPNPFMPADVRFAHLVEVGVSNFAFGWFAARLLAGRAPHSSESV